MLGWVDGCCWKDGIGREIMDGNGSVLYHSFSDTLSVN